MGSLFLLLFIGFILAILVWIVIKVPWWAKPLVIVGAFLAVTADGYLGRRKLEKMCQEQGGLHIYKTVGGVEGFGLGERRPTPSWIEGKGYLFVEGKYRDGMVDRLSIDSLGNITKKNNVSPKGKYQIVTKSNSNDFKSRYYKWEVTLTDDSGEILAKAINFGYRGGWLERFINALYVSRAPVVLCSSSVDHTELSVWKENIIPKVLKPKKKEK